MLGKRPGNTANWPNVVIQIYASVYGTFLALFLQFYAELYPWGKIRLITRLHNIGSFS